jgi:serine/threonine protein kinase
LPVPLALFVTAEMLKGLAYAHERGVVHRDIKPHNTLCSYEGHVKLTDFGIAKLAETGSGASNSEIKGTVGYIAPEVLEGAQCSPRSDLFAIGLVLWECLTGHKLFDGTTDAERIKRTFDCRVPPLRTVVGTASLELEELTIRLLAREPSARFASAREALTMLLAIPGARAAGSEEMKQFLADIFKMEAEAVVKISRRSSKGLQLPTPPTVSAPIRPLPSVIIDLPELLSDGVPRAVAVEETRVLSRPDNRTPTVAGESSPSAVRKRRQWAGAVVVAAVGLLGVLWATGSGQEHPAATPVMVRPEPSVVPDASIPDAAPLPDAAPPDAAPPSQPRRHRKPAPIVPAAAAPPEPVKRVDDDDGIALPPAPL